MNFADQSRAHKIATAFEDLARMIRCGSFTGGYGHFMEHDAWEMLCEDLPESVDKIAAAVSSYKKRSAP